MKLEIGMILKKFSYERFCLTNIRILHDHMGGHYQEGQYAQTVSLFVSFDGDWELLINQSQ